jgi:3',5'-cyclic AMP phosphodiesterase CpdA
LLLRELAQSPQPRVILVHHPALPRQASPAKALSDAAAFEAVLMQHGAELVIHGHNHRPMIAFRDSSTGPIAFVGVPSASHARHHKDEPLARYHLYLVDPADRRRPIELIARGLVSPDGPVEELDRRILVP